ncbi:MAG: HlyC/CorC family transporter [Ruminococcaceae bacterium]|nr:HlyC/CorC family transporter [Oscillospiraceae bacterium]
MIGKLILLIVLISLNAVFASAEIAVISMNDAKLRQLTSEGNKKAIKLSKLVSQPSRFLATIQVAITLAGLLSSAFAADSFAQPIVERLIKSGVGISEETLSTITLVVITLILAYFNLVFGELVPKRIAMKRAEKMALGMSPALYGVSVVFKPIVFILTVSTNLVLRIFGIDPNENDEKVTEEEIRMLLSQGREQGTINDYENEIIQNVFEFNDTTIEQICTHRIDVDSLDADDSIEEWNKTIFETRHTYYPVFRDNNENIIGILDTKDYFRLNKKSKASVMLNAVDEPFYAPEGLKANVLFKQMKSKRRYFAVIIDEYGGFEGIITLHDLMEALVGDMYDIEEGKVLSDIQLLTEGNWRIKGSADIHEVSEVLGVDLTDEDLYDTFNGYVCSVIQRVPNDGETFICETEDFIISVKTVKNHMIQSATVTKKDTEDKKD